MRHSFLRADTKNRFPCSRPWRLPCAGTKGAFAVPPGLKRGGARFHLCLRRISGAGRRGLAEEAQRREARRGRDRPRSRRGGSLATVMGRAVSRAFPARSRERGYFITDCRGLQPEKAPRAKGAGRAACRKSPPAAAFSARSLRNVCAQGRKLPARPAPEGSVCPVGCCAKRKATRRCAERKRQPCGLLPPKVAKRPEGVSKYKGCARQRAERRYLRGSETSRGCG